MTDKLLKKLQSPVLSWPKKIALTLILFAVVMVTTFYVVPEFRSQVCGHTGFCVNLCEWRKERGERSVGKLCEESDTTKKALIKFFKGEELNNATGVAEPQLKRNKESSEPVGKGEPIFVN